MLTGSTGSLVQTSPTHQQTDSQCTCVVCVCMTVVCTCACVFRLGWVIVEKLVLSPLVCGWAGYCMLLSVVAAAAMLHSTVYGTRFPVV